MAKKVIILMILFFSGTWASAETLKLKSGEKIKGKIVDDQATKVIIEVDGKLLTYAWEDIKEISRRVTPEPEPTIEEEPVSEPQAVEISPAEKNEKYDPVSAGMGFKDLQDIPWAGNASTVKGLKYVFTDPANGADVYVFSAGLPEEKGDWNDQVQYHFWKGEYFKMHRPLKDKGEWLALQKECMDRYGSGYRLDGEKDVHQWDEGDVALILCFDAASESGYFEMEFKPIAQNVNLQDSSGFQSLLRALKDESTDVRARAATSLGMMGDERATMPLVRLLKDNDFIVRYNAAQALGEIKDERAVLPLIRSLEDEDGLVRSFAAEALGKIGDQRAVEPLIHHVEENDSALDALVKLTGQHLGPERLKWQEWWQQQKDRLQGIPSFGQNPAP